MVGYVKRVLDNVLQETSKPYGRHIRLAPVAQLSAADALAAARTTAPALPLGAWVRRIMCLVPLQISRCTGNTLEPMHDGEPRCNIADSDDIVELSKQLRWGLYECLLNSHAGPVVVVCALGQQSVGKSYQLNHLGGGFFDVAGGRCTDGVWLGARPFVDTSGQERLAIFLDCEGIGSLERTETEDMLHCLLVGAISSLTMFKTHHVFNACALTLTSRLPRQPYYCGGCYPSTKNCAGQSNTSDCAPCCAATHYVCAAFCNASFSNEAQSAPGSAHVSPAQLHGWSGRCTRTLSASSLICRDLQATLQRLNKGAQKVHSMMGASERALVFRGSLSFCLKDVQDTAGVAVVGEFCGKLNAFVHGDNFIDSIYSGRVTTATFPPLGHHFFKRLENVRFSCSASCPI